jgi:hypothetical protein
VVIVLVVGPKVCGFRLGPDDEFLRTIKIRSTTSFGGKVKPSAPCRKILRHVKDPSGVRQRYFAGKINGHFSPCFSPRRLLVFVRKLLWMNQELLELRWGPTVD